MYAVGYYTIWYLHNVS